MPEDEFVSGGTLTKAAQDRIVTDLRQILDRLDSLELWVAGAYLSSAIDSIQKEDVASQVPRKGS
jgi:hypothetical protein